MKRADSADAGASLQFTSSGLAWLGVVLVTGGVAWWKSINLVLLVVYVMVALVVLNGLLARRNVRRVRARRLSVPPLYVG
ncbi:MAG: hypothetical protein K2V38_13105, partial [Gemmataceae bacterium]|nr:hypothetical protein [Gemmataceae bacterium]